MGNYKIEIEAVGGHGCDRSAKEGEFLAPPSAGHLEGCPDCRFSRIVEALRAEGALVAAKLTHWPGEPGEVVDDLVTRVRLKGQF